MSINFDTDMDSLVGLVNTSINKTFKTRIKEKLMVIAEEVVDEVATEMAKDILSEVESMRMNSMNGEVIQMRLIIGPKKKEKNFVVEKIVKEVK